MVCDVCDVCAVCERSPVVPLRENLFLRDSYGKWLHTPHAGHTVNLCYFVEALDRSSLASLDHAVVNCSAVHPPRKNAPEIAAK